MVTVLRRLRIKNDRTRDTAFSRLRTDGPREIIMETFDFWLRDCEPPLVPIEVLHKLGTGFPDVIRCENIKQVPDICPPI